MESDSEPIGTDLLAGPIPAGLEACKARQEGELGMLSRKSGGYYTAAPPSEG